MNIKIAVLSDIHSNYQAFKTCLDYAFNVRIEHFLFLGDYVSDCAFPQRTMELLYELQDRYHCWFIKGNREEYLLHHKEGKEDGWVSPSSASGSLLYTYDNLTDKDFAFFQDIEISGLMSIDGLPDFLYCHGSMDDTRGDLRFEKEGVITTLENMKEDLLVCGHTHQQGIFEHNGKRIVNVGSVGIPWGHHGKAQFGILSGNCGGWEAELLQLSYDNEKAVRELYESGLTQKANIWAKLVEETLLTGIDRVRDCLRLAMQICEEKEGKAAWSNLSEEYWEEAAKEMGFLS